jgi:hypothetical protein
MKNLLFFVLTIAATLSFSNANAQNANFGGKGQIDVNAGVGLLRTIYGTHTTTVPPISLSAEYGISDKISVGGYLAYTATKDYLWLDDNDFARYSFTIIGARGSYHFNITDKLDTYGGLMLGYAVASSKIESDNIYLDDFAVAASGLALSAHVGARYNFTENMGAFAELGYGVSVLNVGVTFKL